MTMTSSEHRSPAPLKQELTDLAVELVAAAGRIVLELAETARSIR